MSVKNKPIFPILFCWGFILLSSVVTAQNSSKAYFHIYQFQSAPFPHPERDGSDQRYRDSSVAVFIPEGFVATETINFVLYFHGWNNDIQKTCEEFQLLEQFAESKVNAILLLPQGAKNAKDSFYGKLEDAQGLQHLLTEVMDSLFVHQQIKRKMIGNIILSAHSGGFQGLAQSLQKGGLTDKISDVILFDGLYRFRDVFLEWILKEEGRFIHIHTNFGYGPEEEVEVLMQDLSEKQASYFHTEEQNLSLEDLKNQRVIFIYSDLKHHEVIFERNQFCVFLNSSIIPKIE